MANRTCSIDGCESPVHARERCNRHYLWLRRHEDAMAPGRSTCSVDGCLTAVIARGLCGKHHHRFQRYGDPLTTYRPVAAVCSADGCQLPARARGYCNKHHHRFQRHGDPLFERVRQGYVRPDGYRILGWKDHPLALSGGCVMEHRVVLYDAIGPGEHPCHWCGRPVDWAKTYPQSADALVVDHVDGNRLNNHPSNLVPSCNPCNVGRQMKAR